MELTTGMDIANVVVLGCPLSKASSQKDLAPTFKVLTQ